MLVVVSDLHFCDGTAYTMNVGADAFRMLLGEAYDLARKNGAKTLDLLFLGDVFDLLRTEAWFDVAPGDRPWGLASALTDGRPTAACLERAHAILAVIKTKNQPALDVLAGRGEAAPDGIAVRRFLMPGNHDRLALHDDALWKEMLDALGAQPSTALGDQRSRHAVVLPEYGLLARHGHEWDAWNFEKHDPARGSAIYNDVDYLVAPLGDAITTELVAALPYTVARLLRQADFPGDLLAQVVPRLQLIEDVRPTLAAFRWVSAETDRLCHWLSGVKDGATHAGTLTAVLTDAINRLAQDFLALEFFHAWRHAHPALGAAFTAMLEYLSRANYRTAADVVAALQRFGDTLDGLSAAEDPLRKGAARERLDAAAESGLRFVIYGHTHDACEDLLHADAATQDVYLNSGTFRRREFAARDKSGFLGWQQCTWLVFYAAGEHPAGVETDGPSFESWTGQRRLFERGPRLP